MSRLYSLAYLTVPGVTPPEQVRIAHEAGYDAASFRLIQMGVAGEPDIDPCAPEVVRATKAELAATGLQCYDIELARILRQAPASDYERAFATGAELGAKQVISSAWTDVRNDKGFIVDRFSEICDLAAQYGLTVNLEYPAFSRLCCIDDALEILRLANRPNQGLLIDTLYHYFTGGTMADLARVPRKWINFLHVCDTDHVAYNKDEMIHIARDARLYPGDGVISFKLIASMIPDAAISLELPNAELMAKYGRTEHARRCLEGAKRFFDPDARDTRAGHAA
ncbi:sugar phosphate isomerase/epimerase [Sinirhodobacter sp. WL0062]|uniref:Sugar phosphate isomerase/epimerase n=1 Tax=Rhodobacter flavimaris TaxID=2907145 RepID=A0ABS8YXA7_9RHOB|nr:TIM barrel protein [Sinirhodobacter sp. WL0062]MCE5973076.1 sugar phosphate isomerase/epimerase [Sinirhodobacter sp. WL0062]